MGGTLTIEHLIHLPESLLNRRHISTDDAAFLLVEEESHNSRETASLISRFREIVHIPAVRAIHLDEGNFLVGIARRHRGKLRLEHLAGRTPVHVKVYHYAGGRLNDRLEGRHVFAFEDFVVLRFDVLGSGSTTTSHKPLHEGLQSASVHATVRVNFVLYSLHATHLIDSVLHHRVGSILVHHLLELGVDAALIRLLLLLLLLVGVRARHGHAGLAALPTSERVDQRREVHATGSAGATGASRTPSHRVHHGTEVHTAGSAGPSPHHILHGVGHDARLTFGSGLEFVLAALLIKERIGLHFERLTHLIHHRLERLTKRRRQEFRRQTGDLLRDAVAEEDLAHLICEVVAVVLHHVVRLHGEARGHVFQDLHELVLGDVGDAHFPCFRWPAYNYLVNRYVKLTERSHARNVIRDATAIVELLVVDDDASVGDEVDLFASQCFAHRFGHALRQVINVQFNQESHSNLLRFIKIYIKFSKKV